MRRGELYYADLDPVQGSEQGGIRPVLIIQNDLGNRFSPTVIVLPLTSRRGKSPLPTHVPVIPPQGGVKKYSIILCEQVRTLEKTRLRGRLGTLGEQKMALVENALAIALGRGNAAQPEEAQLPEDAAHPEAQADESGGWAAEPPFNFDQQYDNTPRPTGG